MKTVILAGGRGMRFGRETTYKPKPMIEIGDQPILWHIMKRYGLFGVNDFVVCLGYRSRMIKKYFLEYCISQSDVQIDIAKATNSPVHRFAENWDVTLADTGINSLTATRIRQIQPYVDGETFFLTYGDGIGDIDIRALYECHIKSQKTLTITVANPKSRVGVVCFDKNTGIVKSFGEKSTEDSFANIGFMVATPKIFEYLGTDNTMLEDEPFSRLVADGQMNAYIHRGFWSPMDTVKDKEYLEICIKDKDKAPWL